MIYSQIAGTGSHLPEKILTNFDLERMMDTTDAWIRDRTGIERRHIAADGETTVDLAEPAARRAIEAAGVRPQDVDFIAFGTTTPDYIFPNCGVLLQQRLGCRPGCPAFSLETACSGFIYSLAIADKFVRAGEASCALVVGSETLSRITDWSDRSTAVLFADGAGAVVLRPAQQPGIISTHLHADGTFKDTLYCEGGVSRSSPAHGEAQKSRFIRMAGSEVFKIAVTNLGKVVEEALAATHLDRSAIDWLVPHQANTRIIQATARKLDLPMERVIVTVQDHGNTSTASVPLALDVGVRDGRIKRGDLLLLEAFGGGVTWGAALVRY
ncbi:MAG TPA: beta-ketoacyl-ACP synthase III [Steroidobacteraceae bacterium]|nr:beta-ketoacyl-ACP synthase III [Steroidobacteraceae bacterium]